jgi:S1-C subfamily serine protease
VAEYDRLLVSFESILMPASLIAIDYQTGLALLRTQRPLGVPVSLSRQHGCAGQMVVAVGNSLGLRACPALGFCAGFRPDGAIQFSTAITPGAIGGGVFDLSGRLLGAITDGIGSGRVAEAALAVPAHKLPNIIAYLRARGDREAGYVGITTTDIEVFPGIEVVVPHRFASSGGSPTQIIERGTVITDIVSGSPAARAGLQINDLLFSMDGRPISSAWELMEVILRIRPGGKVDLGLLRQNKPRHVSVKVGRKGLAIGGGFSQFPDESFQAIPSQDSLRRELEVLKQSVERLERKLRR